VNAADHGSSVASLALLAWSITLQRLRQVTQNALGEGGSDDDSLLEEVPRQPHQSSKSSLPSAFADAIECVMDLSVDDDPIQYFAKAAVGAGNVFTVIGQLSNMLSATTNISWAVRPELHARVTLLEWVRQALLFTNYSSEVVDATLAVLQVDEPLQSSGKLVASSIRSTLIQMFVRDDAVLVPQLLHQAQSRYPYELTPFLKLCKALCPGQRTGNSSMVALPLSEATSRFTQVLPHKFDRYELVREAEDTNCIRLMADLPLFSDRAISRGTASAAAEARQLQKSHVSGELYISQGTIGYVISDSPPFVVMWEHEHSALRYLGALLSTVPTNSSRKNLGSVEGNLDKDTQADIIDLLAALSEASVDPHQEVGKDQEDARWLLDQTSDSIDRNADILVVVMNIFEDELGSQSQGREDGSTELLCACIHFIRAVVKVMPSRIWPFLARSDFLAISGRGGRMSVMLESSELAAGRAQLMHECVALYEALCADIMQNAVARKAPVATAGRRFNQASDVATGSPRKVLAKILLSLTQSFVNIVLNTGNGNVPHARAGESLHGRIIKIFEQLLSSIYGVDDQNKPDDKLASAMAPAASFLIEVFLAAKDNTPTTALLALSLSTSGSATSSELLQTTLQFFTTLLEVGTILDQPSSYLEQKLFQSLPFFARAYVSAESVKHPIILLLSGLVDRAGSSEAEPRSLLGHLGPQTARDFLTILGSLDQPLHTPELEASIWRLVSLVMSCRQQWFATYIVTGDSPKNSVMKKDESTTSTQQPILALALDQVARMTSLSTAKAVALLTFVNSAQSYWPWITNKLVSHNEFTSRILDDLGELRTDLSVNVREQSYLHAATAQIIDILALILHNTRQMGDMSFVKRVGPKLGYLRAHGVAVPKYNTSLHYKLKQNIEDKFHFALVSIKRLTSNSLFGDNYCYDLDFADLVLTGQSAWLGTKESFRNEVRLANENLSLVEAHILLMTSWRTLAMELSQHLESQKDTLQTYLAVTVEQCLTVNMGPNPPEPIFQQLLESRTQLALALMQRLVTVKSAVPGMTSLLAKIWATIRVLVPDFEIAFAGVNLSQYRSLLRLLLLGLQPHTYINTPEYVSTTSDGRLLASAQWSQDVLPLLLEIITHIVGTGFRSLTEQVHGDFSSVQPADFALITAILQSILRIPNVSSAYTALTLRLCDTNVDRYAIALFSWSDRLTIPSQDSASTSLTNSATDDPVFADLTLSFLHTLTTIPPMAEYLATQGLLSQLSTAPILSTLRLGRPSASSRSTTSATATSVVAISTPTSASTGFGPLDNPLRFHNFWSRSILPLTLHILTAVGASFAAEAAAFLNTFPAQIARASDALGPTNGGPGITLSEAAELTTLSLLARALNEYAGDPVAAAGSDGSALALRGWDGTGVKEDVEAWLRGGSAGLEGKIVPVGEREVGLLRMKGESGEGSKLAEMVRRELDVVVRCSGGDA